MVQRLLAKDLTHCVGSMCSAIIVLLAVLTTAAAAIAAGKLQGNELDGYAVFNGLSKEEASKKARQMAETDFARNAYRILVVGKRPATNAYDDYLKEKYGVLVTPIAGCVISDGIIAAQKSYNSTVKPLLNRKFGRGHVAG